MVERKALSKNALDERIIRVGLSMRLAGFGPLTRNEIKKMLEMSDGGTPPMGEQGVGLQASMMGKEPSGLPMLANLGGGGISG